jgi:hypothetical protein
VSREGGVVLGHPRGETWARGGALLGNFFYERRKGRMKGLKKVEKGLSVNMKGFVNSPENPLCLCVGENMFSI